MDWYNYRDGLKNILGKKITGIAMVSDTGSHHRLYLFFSDETYYEFYTSGSSEISGIKQLGIGTDLKRRCKEECYRYLDLDE